MLSPCEMEFSRGNGTGVAEAIGNWGFFNYTPSANIGGVERMKCLYREIEKLKTTKPAMKVIYNRMNDPGAWHVCPSPDECKPSWTFPKNRPLITYSSTAEMIPVSSYLSVKNDVKNSIPGRTYVWENMFSPKWYKVDCGRCCPASNSCVLIP